MGTETVYSLLSICLRFHIIVKLNNPLMGTETIYSFELHLTF